MKRTLVLAVLLIAVISLSVWIGGKTRHGGTASPSGIETRLGLENTDTGVNGPAHSSCPPAAEDASEMRLDSVRLQDKPLLGLDNIVSYDWTNHTVRLRPEAMSKLPRLRTYGTPFAARADGPIVYLGAFGPVFTSVPRSGPSLMLTVHDRDHASIDWPIPAVTYVRPLRVGPCNQADRS